MTSREARRQRREVERKAAKLAYKAAKSAGEPGGFVSQGRDEQSVAGPNPPQQPEPASQSIATPSRAEINRENSRLSTGPRTSAGKLASSRNATKHGLASGQLIVPGEDPAAFDSLLASLLQDHQPANSTEELLVNEMAQSYWLEQRAIALQNGCFTENGVDEKHLALFLRYGTTHNRAFYKALATLARLQKERRKLEIGFVSQSRASVAHDVGFVSQNKPSADPKTGFVSQTDHVDADPEEQSTAKAA